MKPDEFDAIRAMAVAYAARLQDPKALPPGPNMIAHALLRTVEMMDLLLKLANEDQRPHD